MDNTKEYQGWYLILPTNNQTELKDQEGVIQRGMVVAWSNYCAIIKTFENKEEIPGRSISFA